MMTRGLLDTSVFIARESGRPIETASLPEEGYVSVVTLAEMQAGVLAAGGTDVRARRLATLDRVAAVASLDIDATVAAQWARLRVRLHEAGRRMDANDAWIAAVAMAHDLPVVTQDTDFDAPAELGLVSVVRV